MSAFGDLFLSITQLDATAPLESILTSYRGDLIVIVRAGVVSGLVTTGGVVVAAAGCAGAVVVGAAAATFAFVLAFPSTGAGFGAKNICHVNNTAIESAAAIKNRD